MKFRNQKILAKVTSNVISPTNLKLFPLVSNVGDTINSTNKSKRRRLRQSLSRVHEVYQTSHLKVNFSSQQSNTVRDINENRSQAYAR